MRRRITLPIFIALLIVGAVAVLWALLFYPHKPEPWKQVTIATATEGGTYYVLGDQLARLLDRLPGKRVVAEQSRGSLENIQRLINSKADLALVQGPALVEAAREHSETEPELQVLARLYTDAVQIVVGKDTGIEDVNDLKNKKIYIGAEDSGTRMLAMHILETTGLFEGDYTADKAVSYAEATDKLISGKLVAAIFAAGTPTEAVGKALQSGKCRLLSLEDELRKRLGSGDFRLENANIPANFYPNQPGAVETVGADVFLVCRKDLPKDLAFVILEALFDNIEKLAHAKAQEIKLTEAFEYLPLPLHSGARKFKDEEEGKLLIATGALNGKYYQVGKAIQDFLEPWGIPARAIQTDGSLENADLLKKIRPTTAIMQFDAALACFGKPSFYDVPDMGVIPQIRDIRRIAALHEEKLHVVVCRKKLEQIERELDKKITRLDELREALLLTGEKISVCVGPKGSASQVVSRAILNNHKIELFIERRFLPVSEMVSRLQNEELDMGFFVSYVPSEAMRDILDSDRVRLLSLGYKERKRMVGAVFSAVTIDPKEYACQREDGDPIETIATRAVLVTTEKLPSDVVKTITKAIFENIAFLDIKDFTRQDMANLPTIPLHSGAVQYYKEAGLLFSEPPLLHRLQTTWYILGCLTMLITVMFIPAYTGLIILRRSRTGNEIGRRILAIPIEASVRDSVQRLLKIRDEIQKRVRRRWWRWGELDKHRWRYLRDLIHDRIGEAKENLTRAFVAEIRDVARNPELGKATRKQRYRSIEDRILEYFEKAELDPSQQKMLRELLRETSQQDAKTKESKGIKK